LEVGAGEGRMDGELNMVIREKKEGKVILLYLPAHISLCAFILPL